MQFKLSVVLAFALLNLTSAAYVPRQDGAPGAPGTPSGKAPGTQFVTGNCASDADCQSKCCAKGKGTNGSQKDGVCANEIPTKERGQTCGFTAGDLAGGAGAGGNNGAAGASGAAAPAASGAAGANNAAANNAAAPPAGGAAAGGTGKFITAACTKDSECAEGCCSQQGKCAGVIIALQRDGGCGCGAQPNDNAARAKFSADQIPPITPKAPAPQCAPKGGAQGGATGGAANNAANGDANNAANGAANNAATGAASDNAATGAAANNAAANNAAAPPAGGAAAGGTGKFITAACTKDSECAEGCCSQQGKCAGVIIALQRDGGCGCGAKPNDNAARAKFPANQIPPITPKAPAAQCAPKGGA